MRADPCFTGTVVFEWIGAAPARLDDGMDESVVGQVQVAGDIESKRWGVTGARDVVTGSPSTADGPMGAAILRRLMPPMPARPQTRGCQAYKSRG